MPTDVRHFWNVRDGITEIKGILFHGDRIIIPTDMRPAMLKVLHEGHMGMEKTKARARVVLYWPNMGKDIQHMVAKCPACLRFRKENEKEPLKQHPIPARPWQTVAADIMSFKGRDYILVVDYYSKYPEVALLQNKTASSVVTHMKSIFARHGIPEKLICDNMPFASRQFRAFADLWGINVETTSPTYAQSNGEAERFVQTVKQMFRKIEDNDEDPYIALLQYRNAPVAGVPYSPAEMLMSRRLRDKLPTTRELLMPKVVHPTSQLRKEKRRQKQC